MKEKILSLINRIRYKYPSILKITSQEEMILRALILTRYLVGDYLEFGVYKGASLIPAYHFKKNNDLDMNIIAFDSFVGLPETRDEGEEEEFQQGAFSTTKEEVENILRINKVEDVKLIEGFFDKTLNEKTRKEINVKKVKAVYIDVDLYSSTKQVLDFIIPYLQDGTILMFDDWFCFRGNEDKGSQRAVKEWLKENKKINLKELCHFSWGGRSFVVNIK